MLPTVLFLVAMSHYDWPITKEKNWNFGEKVYVKM
jgi:hypothetical protein